MLISRRFLLRRSKMLRFLDELEKTSGKAKSLYISSGSPSPEVKDLLQKALAEQDIPAGMSELAVSSKTGAILFWGASQRCIVLPPFPVTEKYLAQGYDVEPLRSLLQYDFSLALVLIRLSSYAIGICQGENLIDSKVGTAYIHSRHKKGGSSQHRFERHREKQIEYFLQRVCGHIKERLEPHAHTLDYIVYGGAKTTILSLQKKCSFLNKFYDRTLPPLLTISEPNRVVLEMAISQAWSSSLTEWHDNEISS